MERIGVLTMFAFIICRKKSFTNCLIVLMLIFILPLFGSPRIFAGEPSYPRIGIFHWSSASVEWYAKFDLVLTLNKRNSFAERVKALNPNAIVVSCVEDWNCVSERRVGGSYPSAWRVKDSQGNEVKIYGGGCVLGNISNYCPLVDGKRYNDQLIEDMSNAVDLSVYDGVFSDGVWDHPYGTKDVDLDRNGVNDWDEHGRDWLESVWLAGVHKTAQGIRNRIGDKILILNSGRFHNFEWETANGLILEHQPPTIYSMQYFKNQYDNWMATAPTPHVLLVDGKGDSKNSYSEMRFLLGLTLLGDGYFSFTESAASEHHYTKYYDEYDLDLGYPKGKPRSLFCEGDNYDCVWIRFFDNGVSIVNVSGKTQIITNDDLEGLNGYNGPYYRFKGGQDPNFNNGEQFDDIELMGKRTSRGDATLITGDGIILLKQPQTVVSDIIIDNVDAATSPGSSPAEFTNNWQQVVDRHVTAWTMGGRSYREIYDYAISSQGAGEADAIYRPTFGVPAYYDVYEWHGWHGPNKGDDEASNVPCEIHHANGVTKKTIDQTRNYSRWNYLGTFYFNKGNDGFVKISNDANGVVIADAFKFVYKGSNPHHDANPPAPPQGVQVKE